MANPSLDSNTSQITISAIPKEADIKGAAFDVTLNAANNFRVTINVNILQIFGDDLYFIKTTLPSKIYRVKYDQVIVESL